MSDGASADCAKLGIATLIELTVATIRTRLRHIAPSVQFLRAYTLGSSCGLFSLSNGATTALIQPPRFDTSPYRI